jgi:hypothetical protein
MRLQDFCLKPGFKHDLLVIEYRKAYPNEGSARQSITIEFYMQNIPCKFKPDKGFKTYFSVLTNWHLIEKWFAKAVKDYNEGSFDDLPSWIIDFFSLCNKLNY